MTTELKPCPHCGADALLTEHEPHEHSPALVAMGLPGKHPGSFTIECVACECGMINATREGVVAAWNRRATPTPLADAAAIAEPTPAMLTAARDWSAKKYGKPIGNDAAIGCWKAMYAALHPAAPEKTEGAMTFDEPSFPSPDVQYDARYGGEVIRYHSDEQIIQYAEDCVAAARAALVPTEAAAEPVTFGQWFSENCPEYQRQSYSAADMESNVRGMAYEAWNFAHPVSEPQCGLSWNGFNIKGDEKSIKEVRHLVNIAGQNKALHAEIDRLTASGPQSEAGAVVSDNETFSELMERTHPASEPKAALTARQRSAVESGIAALEKLGWTYRVADLRALLRESGASEPKAEAAAAIPIGYGKKTQLDAIEQNGSALLYSAPCPDEDWDVPVYLASEPKALTDEQWETVIRMHFVSMKDDEGQGIHPYYKDAFRDGVKFARALLRESEQSK